MDRFTEAEMVGREIVYSLISGHCKNYFFCEKENSGVDMFVTGYTGTKAVLEIKYRSGYTSTSIENMGGQMLEWKKYNDLMKQKSKGYIPLYTVVFSDKMLMWDVSSVTDDRFVIENKYKKTTVGEDHRNIEKKVAYLKIGESCTIITRNEKDNRKDSNRKDCRNNNIECCEERKR
jgi:hypothetical protein